MEFEVHKCIRCPLIIDHAKCHFLMNHVAYLERFCAQVPASRSRSGQEFSRLDATYVHDVARIGECVTNFHIRVLTVLLVRMN